MNQELKMNELTKEELHTLNYLIDFYCERRIPPPGGYGVLQDKIQSLIDNYGKKDEVVTTYN